MADEELLNEHREIDESDEINEIDADLEPRVKTWEFIIMLITALLLDLSQWAVPIVLTASGSIIPVIGNILGGYMGLIGGSFISIIAFITFTLWFKLKGVSLMLIRRLTTTVGTFLIELIPGFNLVPTWTLYVIVMFVDTKITDSRRITRVKGMLKSIRV